MTTTSCMSLNDAESAARVHPSRLRLAVGHGSEHAIQASGVNTRNEEEQRSRMQGWGAGTQRVATRAGAAANEMDADQDDSEEDARQDGGGRSGARCTGMAKVRKPNSKHTCKLVVLFIASILSIAPINCFAKISSFPGQART